MQAIAFLTKAGQITNDKRQEFILLSDVLGLSTLVTAQNNMKPSGCTESTVFGPFFVDGAPRYENRADIANGAKGTPCFVSAQVRGLAGEPVADAVIDVWQSDEDGRYDVQTDVQTPGEHVHRARGQLRSNSDGRFHFRSIVAVPYAIPDDGPVGAMLTALGRHPWRPAHLHFMIQAPGYQTLITHVFRDGDPYLDSDAVFGVRSSLIANWVAQPSQALLSNGVQDGLPAGRPDSHVLEYDFVLNAHPDEK
jgi:hydroxyquinol 1,2-dioxygenase